MLFHQAPTSLTTDARATRIRCLERHVRQASDGQYKIQDYLEWLQAAHIPVPSRQALHDDVAFYAALCDDMDYGRGSKWMRIDPGVDRDAIHWFMGSGWTDLPVRPRLSSAVARCLLMAQYEQHEVQFLYAKLEQLGRGLAQAETWRVIPHHVAPGLDSAYMVMWLHSGRVATFNLARIIGRVMQTGQGTAHYAPARDEAVRSYAVRCPDEDLLTQLRTQYGGLDVHDSQGFTVTTEPSIQHFLGEMLQGWIWRTTHRRGVSEPRSLTWTVIDPKEDLS